MRIWKVRKRVRKPVKPYLEDQTMMNKSTSGKALSLLSSPTLDGNETGGVQELNQLMGIDGKVGQSCMHKPNSQVQKL
jgi:hypothetical protein